MHSDRYPKNDFLKNIVQVTKHVNFQLCRGYPGGVIWKNLTTDKEYINKQARLFIHQTKLDMLIRKKLLGHNKNISL